LQLNGVSAESPGEDARQGVEQPHVVKGVPQAFLEVVVATPAIQTRETPKSEETPSEAVAWSSAEVQATFTVQSEGPMKEKLTLESMTKAEVAEEQTKVESAEDKNTIEAENARSHAMQAEEQISEQRETDKATRAGASASSPMNPVWSSSGSNWFSKIFQAAPGIIPEEESALLPKSTIPRTSDILPNGRNTSPSAEFGPIPSDSSPGASVQCLLTTTNPTPHEPQSMYPVNSITVTPSSASVMPSLPNRGSHEREQVNGKQDGKRFQLI
jgi:hypothetical protein